MNSHSISTIIITTSLPAAGRRVPNRKPALQTRTRVGTNGDDADKFVPSPRGANLIDPKDGQQPRSLQCANANRIGNFDRDVAFGPIVGDSATFEDYEEELKYAFKNYLYELLKHNDSLLTLGFSTDSSFQRFYTEMDTSNIGSFGAIREAIDSNMVDSAATLNELVTDINSIEYSRKSVNSVIINKILQGLDLDATDSTLLEYVFAQHWIQAGKAVYETAGILGKEYHSPQISFRKSTSAHNETKKTDEQQLNIKIHPNPTSNHVTISVPENITFVFELKDIYNRICIQKENINELDVSTFTSGIYAVRILVNNKVQYSGKLVIIK
ncbi:MAG: T9SS type A sorting domain-containing protein [Bacteroidetes bacterium]|nr:T9SS type A sorting domain-containing protein [Bacteroidota bacterium]